MKIPKKEKATEKLLQAATKLFAEKGYHETSVRDIARSAGVNPSLINYHFGGKEELYRRILEKAGIETHLRFQRILGEIESSEEFSFRFKMLVEELVRGSVQNFDVQRIIEQVIHNQGDIGEEVFRERHFTVLQKIITFIENAQNKDYIKNDMDARLVGLLVVAFVRNISLLRHAIKNFMDLDIEGEAVQQEIVETLLKLVLGGLKREDDSSPLT